MAGASPRVKFGSAQEGQVSSRGCSKAFIVCVYSRIFWSCHQKWQQDQALSWPFTTQELAGWLKLAKKDMVSQEETWSETFGGCAFSIDDPTSFWTSPDHFKTFHKNNIERSKKLHMMVNLANSSLMDVADADQDLEKKKTLYNAICRLSTNIRMITNSRSSEAMSKSDPIYSLPSSVPSYLWKSLEGQRWITGPVKIVADSSPMSSKTHKRKTSKTSKTNKTKDQANEDLVDDYDAVDPLHEHLAPPLKRFKNVMNVDFEDHSAELGMVPAVEGLPPVGGLDIFDGPPTLELSLLEMSELPLGAWETVLSPFGLSISIDVPSMGVSPGPLSSATFKVFHSLKDWLSEDDGTFSSPVSPSVLKSTNPLSLPRF